jgi:NDP-sugar pyrophosphorylase family protein
MEAVILAGGQGTRLRPYTTTIPKPLVPVGERAILDIVLRQLRKAGVVRVRMAVNHMADLIMAFFGSGEKYGLEIVYSIEDEPLGTVGPLANMSDLPQSFLVMNGDVLTDLDYAALFRSHVASGCALTLSTYRRKLRMEFGILEVNEQARRLVGFREKPMHEFDASMGVYAFDRRTLAGIPSKRRYGLDDLVLDMLRKNEPIHTFPWEGYWLDLGRPDDYDQANRDIDQVFPKEAL